MVKLLVCMLSPFTTEEHTLVTLSPIFPKRSLNHDKLTSVLVMNNFHIANCPHTSSYHWSLRVLVNCLNLGIHSLRFGSRTAVQDGERGKLRTNQPHDYLLQGRVYQTLMSPRQLFSSRHLLFSRHRIQHPSDPGSHYIRHSP